MKRIILFAMCFLVLGGVVSANGGQIMVLSDVFFLFQNGERYTENDIVFAYRQDDGGLKIGGICVEGICKTDYADVVEMYKITDKDAMNEIWSSFNICLDQYNKVLDDVYLFDENRYSTRNLCSEGGTSMLELINGELNGNTASTGIVPVGVFEQIAEVLNDSDSYEILDRWNIENYPVDFTNTLGTRYQQKIGYDLTENKVIFFTDYFYSPLMLSQQRLLDDFYSFLYKQLKSGGTPYKEKIVKQLKILKDKESLSVIRRFLEPLYYRVDGTNI